MSLPPCDLYSGFPRQRRAAALLSGVLAVLLALSNCRGDPYSEHARDRETLAVVGRYLISATDFQEFLADNRASEDAPDVLRSRLWDRLVEEVLVLNDAVSGVSDGETVPLRRAGTAQERGEAVELTLQKCVYSKVHVSDAQVLQYYRDHPEEFRKGRGYLLRQILVPTRALAEDARRTLGQRHSFESVARLYTVLPDQGAVQYFEDEQLSEYLIPILMRLRPGEPSPPIHVAADTYQIVQIERRLESYVLPFADVSTPIRLQLSDAAGETLYRQYLDDLRERFPVRVFPKKLPFVYQKETP